MRAIPNTGAIESNYADRGFGGVVGAQRHVPPEDHSKVETLPVAKSAEYGDEPGRQTDYGTRGVGDPGQEVSGNQGKARLALGNK